MKILTSPVRFYTLEGRTIEARACRGRSFFLSSRTPDKSSTRASVVLQWDYYIALLNAWRESGNPRKSAWLSALVVTTDGLSEGFGVEQWAPDKPYIVDEIGCNGCAVFHLKKLEPTAPNYENLIQ